MSLASGGFSQRADRTENFVQAVENTILTPDRYFNIQTGIEYRFGDEAEHVHQLLYNSMGPTTDLLRYFPDNLYLDRWRIWSTWELQQQQPIPLDNRAQENETGLFTFFVEYKYSYSERPTMIGEVPTKYIGILEREAWLTYKRLTSPNPNVGIYLDKHRTRIALFYAATYAPGHLFAGWEEDLEPINIIERVARPGVRTIQSSRGSGTPYINFDIRQLKPLENFLEEDLFWDREDVAAAVEDCRRML